MSKTAVLLLAAFFAAACSRTPTSPTGASENFTWTVDGQSFTATSNGRYASHSGASVSMTGAACNAGAHVSLRFPNTGPGTYTLGTSTPVATWTPDARTGSADAWNAPGIPRVVDGKIVSGGSGSVTVTSLSSDWVSGTFRFEVVPNPANKDMANKIIEGSFELSFKERTVC
ncbi:MAG: hypothetical protein IT184_13980 [Acidobacteria bacterium]|nr:hypothetical protein [Acidobacteriota bacterium]